MQILTDLFVAFIASYLAFTNHLAMSIEDWLTADYIETPVIVETTTEADMPELPSKVGQAIPDVLLTSVRYQQAAVAGTAGLTGATTRDPLAAMVNIFCNTVSEDSIRTTTGTGFFIDPDGVIMTNAHVAQFLILENTNQIGEATCIVRSGNPASPKYHAELLYIPPTWIQDNAKVMHDDHPMGTGERDYALLYVSSTVDDSPLPAVFPALGFDTRLLPLSTRDNAVLAAGYPAEPLLRNGASADLIPRQASTTVSELYTFGSNYADVFSIRGSEVGAEGSSGGPVLNEDGNVIGMIVTRGDDTVDGPGSLRAITLSHIERTILEETNFDLTQNLSGNLKYRSEVFADTMTPFLLTILQQAAN
ncbi:trypsin-like peptidase domain-containing protein [Candidatus Kaiserbacteria bacterium]|nr:trypsin-like peptidase domain-containing protein [Candidatus Kaiserbacteria bacterium]